jgi:hypothetical protein
VAEPVPADAPPPGPTSVEANIRDKFWFRYAIAVVSEQGLDVRLLSDATETCEHYAKEKYTYVSDAPEKGHRLRFVLPRGPGNTFYAGHPIGAEIVDSAKSLRIGADEDSDYVVIRPSHNTIKIESVDLRKEGRLKGTISFAADHNMFGKITGRGGFDAEICGVPNQESATPALVPKTPVSGRIGPLPFSAKSAIAVVGNDGAQRYVVQLALSSTPGLTCADFVDGARAKKNHVIIVDSIGGSGESSPIVGFPQPANAEIFSANEHASWWKARRRTWVQFDALPFTAGAKITGSLYAGSWKDGVPEAAGQVAGRFEALVCP